MVNVRIGLVGLATIASTLGMPTSSMAQKRQRDLITREELMGNSRPDQNLYEVIRHLRPHMLQVRPGVRSLGNSNQAGLSVYIDRKRDVGIEVLRTLRTEMVEEVRYMDPAKAESEFGFVAGGGAVMVKLYKAPKDPTGS